MAASLGFGTPTLVFPIPSPRITRFLEKPPEGLSASRLASVVFHCLQRDSLAHLSDFLSLRPQSAARSFGHFWVGETGSGVAGAERTLGGSAFSLFCSGVAG